MKSHELTNRSVTATIPAMQGRAENDRKGSRSPVWAVGMLVSGALALGGCISVNAPDKPIVIELNINIKQEVVYRLAADAGNTIEEHGDIF